MAFHLTLDILESRHRYDVASELRKVAATIEKTAEEESPSKIEYIYRDGEPVGEWKFTP